MLNSEGDVPCILSNNTFFSLFVKHKPDYDLEGPSGYEVRRTIILYKTDNTNFKQYKSDSYYENIQEYQFFINLFINV